MFVTVFHERFRRYAHSVSNTVKVCPQCDTIVYVKRSVCDCCHAFASKKRKARCTTVGEPENAMEHRKALLTKEELLVTKERDKVRKASESF